jgi:hypothetical protein
MEAADMVFRGDKSLLVLRLEHRKFTWSPGFSSAARSALVAAPLPLIGDCL